MIINEYNCPRCEYLWQSVDDDCPDDDCSECNLRHIAPRTSIPIDLLEEISQSYHIEAKNNSVAHIALQK